MHDTTAHLQRTKRFDLRALFEASRLLSGSLDLRFVLNNLLLTAMSKLLVTRGIGLLCEKDIRAARVVIHKGIATVEDGALIAVDTLDEARVLQHDEIPDTLRQHQLALLLPIISADERIGWIGLGKKATGAPFSEEELEFIQSLVNMSAAAVKNSLIVDELRQTNRELDAKIQQLNTLFDLSQEFNASFDRAHLLKLLTFTLMGQMLVNRHLFIIKQANGGENGGTLDVIAAHGVSDTAFSGAVYETLAGLEQTVHLDATPNPDLAPLVDARLTLVLPIRHQGETNAVLCLGPKMTGQPYVDDDIELLSALGNMAYVSVQNTYLVEEQIEKERLEEELRLARDIQIGLLPQTVPEIPGLDIAAMAFPSRQVGGDYYDLVAQANDSLLIAIADVTGKGLPASLLMANLQACLHTMVPMDLTLEEVSGHMNRVICQNTGFDKFITAFLALYHPEKRSVDYVNAGHNPPMLLRADGTIELLETGGLLLGVMKDMPYERGQTCLEAGDVLALFTDGVTEAMSPDEEEYGEERLEALLKDHQDASAEEILDAVRNDIIAFTGSATMLSDDLTMIVVKGT